MLDSLGYGRRKFIGTKPENNEMARARSPSSLEAGRCSAIRLRRERVAAFFSSK
jgi:hypothetical protein